MDGSNTVGTTENPFCSLLLPIPLAASLAHFCGSAAEPLTKSSDLKPPPPKKKIIIIIIVLIKQNTTQQNKIRKMKRKVTNKD